jgi:hypothetical protein
MTPDQAKNMIPQFFENYVPAAGMATGGAPVGKTPEMMHEESHQKMTAEQAKQDLLNQQQADAAHQAQVASAMPTATGTPDNPTGAPPVAPPPGVSGVPMPGQTPNGDLASFLQGQVNDAGMGESNAQAQMDDALKAQGSGIDLETKGKKSELAAQVAEQQKEQPLLHQKTEEAARFEAQQKQIMQAGQKAYDAQMVRVRSAVDAANQAEVKNFWSDSSVASKIFGVLAQALSGAANGLAGNPSAVTPLDRLIEQDMQRQQMNLAQKNKAAYREQGMLSTIEKQTGDRVAALNALKMAAWERIDRQVAELKGAMGGPVAAAQAQQISGLAQQRKAMYNDKMGERLLEKAQRDKQIAMHSLGVLDASQAAISKQRARAAENHFTVVGLKDDGQINKSQYDKAATFSENYAAYVAANKMAKEIAAEGMTANPLKQKARYDKAVGSMKAAVRQMDATGAAQSPDEIKTAMTRIPQWSDIFVPGYSNLYGGAKQLDDSADAVTDSYVARMRGLGIQSAIDPNDAIAGEHLTRYVQRHARHQAQ